MKKLVALMLLLLVTPVFAGDDWDKAEENVPDEEFNNPQSEFKPFTVFELGFSYRTDEWTYYDKDLGVRAKLVSHFTPAVAAVVGVGYFPGFRETFPHTPEGDNIKEYQVEGGLRLSAYELPITPFLECTYQYHHYNGAGDMPSETKSGLGLSAGMEYFFSDQFMLGFNIQHVFNHIDFTDYVVTDNSPPPWPYDGPYPSFIPQSVYNPTTISLMVGFKL